MNIGTMKKIDHYGGTIVCLVLDLLQKARSLFPSRKVSAPERIMAMKFFGLGSILLSTPMLRAIKEKYPSATIGFLTFSANEEFVAKLGLVDEIYPLRTDSLTHFLVDVVRQLRRIRRKGYDVVLDMEFFSKFSTIMTYLSGSPVRIGYFLRQMWRGDLLTEQVYYNHYRHITEVFGALAAPIGVGIKDYSLTKPAIPPEEDLAAARLLRNEGIRETDCVIGVNVNTSDLSRERRWPKEEFQALVSMIRSEVDARFVFIGTQADRGYVAEAMGGTQNNGNSVNLAGKTGVGDLLSILKRCSLFISNDSGPLHMAAALGTPTVSFFGPETPILYGPMGQDSLVFHENIYCSPCLNVFNVKTAPCGGRNACMDTIKADEVFRAVKRNFGWIWEKYGIAR